MNKENYSIIVPCVKTFNVVRNKFYNNIYDGDVTGIASWFYHTAACDVDDITITVYGGIHRTYPNPQHLTVEITHDDYSTGRIHMSIDDDGYWYQQKLTRGGDKKNQRYYT
tara:strand:+ start:1242 stop:1574 length:333 start_codon:yes stop_codon:yes gene_type:complete